MMASCLDYIGITFFPGTLLHELVLLLIK